MKSGMEWRAGAEIERAEIDVLQRARVPRTHGAYSARGALVVEREQDREQLPQRTDRESRVREVVVVHLDADHERGP